MTAEVTGNRKCWHVFDLTRDSVVESGLRRNSALIAALAYQSSGKGNASYCRDGYKLIPCDGAAHSNPHIDNCGRCAPRWGWLMVKA